MATPAKTAPKAKATTVKAHAAKPAPKAASGKKERYFESVGRRKTSIARVRLTPVTKGIEVVVNGKKFEDYFPLAKHRAEIVAPFEAVSATGYEVSAKATGGGVSGQAEAIRLGISRSLIRINNVWRPRLKALGFLKRDPRAVERKHPGLRKARRPQQWRKR